MKKGDLEKIYRMHMEPMQSDGAGLLFACHVYPYPAGERSCSPQNRAGPYEISVPSKA